MPWVSGGEHDQPQLHHNSTMSHRHVPSRFDSLPITVPSTLLQKLKDLPRKPENDNTQLALLFQTGGRFVVGKRIDEEEVYICHYEKSNTAKYKDCSYGWEEKNLWMCVQCLGSSPLKLDVCSMASCKGMNPQSFKEYVEGRGIDYGSESVGGLRVCSGRREIRCGRAVGYSIDSDTCVLQRKACWVYWLSCR
jgi:hypothetical protein